MSILSIILTLVILGIIIFIHELGHFATSKFFGIPVSEFALGMGPKITSFKWKGTEYSLRAIPMGGFVNIEGIEVGDTSETGFNAKKPYQRFIVLFAGVFMNFILAFVVLLALFIGNGENRIDKSNRIGGVLEESGSYNKILENDRIISIDGKKIEQWDDILNSMKNYNGNGIAIIEIDRNGKKITENIEMVKIDEVYKLGVSPAYNHINYSLINGVIRAGEECVNIVVLTFKGFGMIFSGVITSEEVSGPVGMVKVVKGFMGYGILPLIYLVAFLSMNVGVMNLLPIPALDGGRILFVIFEKVGIKVDKALEEKIHKVGMAILLTLIILLTINDVLNIGKPLKI
jgi:regulator of sigma E protease